MDVWTEGFSLITAPLHHQNLEPIFQRRTMSPSCGWKKESFTVDLLTPAVSCLHVLYVRIFLRCGFRGFSAFRVCVRVEPEHVWYQNLLFMDDTARQERWSFSVKHQSSSAAERKRKFCAGLKLLTNQEKNCFPKNQNKAPFHLFYHWRIASHLLPSCFWSVSGLISGLPPHCFWSVSKLFLICFWSVSGLDSGLFFVCFYPVSGLLLICFSFPSSLFCLLVICSLSTSCLFLFHIYFSDY